MGIYHAVSFACPARLLRTIIQVFGGGLMIGGRGLPTNLGSIETSADGIQVKLDAPVDQSSSELDEAPTSKRLNKSLSASNRETVKGSSANRPLDPVGAIVWKCVGLAIRALGRCATIHERNILVKARSGPRRRDRGPQPLVQPRGPTRSGTMPIRC